MLLVLTLLITWLVTPESSAAVVTSHRAIPSVYSYDVGVQQADARAGGHGAIERLSHLAMRPQPSTVQVAFGFAAEDAGAGVDAAAARGPSFVGRSNGEVIRVPEGATGPTPTDNGLGFQFRGGSGGDPLDSRVAGVRIMDPVTSGKYLYPNGYVSYENGLGQTVNPFTGQTIAPSDSFWHWALEP